MTREEVEGDLRIAAFYLRHAQKLCDGVVGLNRRFPESVGAVALQAEDLLNMSLRDRLKEAS